MDKIDRKPARKHKTKTFLIGNELKTKDLLQTAAERTSEPPTKTRIKTPGERRVKPLARFSTLSVARILGSGERSGCGRVAAGDPGGSSRT